MSDESSVPREELTGAFAITELYDVEIKVKRAFRIARATAKRHGNTTNVLATIRESASVFADKIQCTLLIPDNIILREVLVERDRKWAITVK